MSFGLEKGLPLAFLHDLSIKFKCRQIDKCQAPTMGQQFGLAGTRSIALMKALILLGCLIGFLSLSTLSFAQANSPSADPSSEIATMRPGQQLRRPTGLVEITTFTRSDDEKGPTFSIEFMFRNDTQGNLNIVVEDYVRVVVDDVPYSPTTHSPDFMSVRMQSAQYAQVTFRVRGHPRKVFVRFGSGEGSRSVVRWPE